MQRLLNSAENYVDEMLEGIYFAYPNQVTSVGNDLRCYVSKKCETRKSWNRYRRRIRPSASISRVCRRGNARRLLYRRSISVP